MKTANVVSYHLCKKSLDMTTPNGCKVTLIFGNKPELEIRREVAEMLLAAFQRNVKESAS